MDYILQSDIVSILNFLKVTIVSWLYVRERHFLRGPMKIGAKDHDLSYLISLLLRRNRNVYMRL